MAKVVPIRTGIPGRKKSSEDRVTDERITQIADAAGRELAATDDVVELNRLALDLTDFKAEVAGVTKDRDKINKVGLPLLKTQVKLGRALRRMAETGERQARGNNSALNERGVPSLSDIGFTSSRAQRYQIAGIVPDKMIDDYVDWRPTAPPG